MKSTLLQQIEDKIKAKIDNDEKVPFEVLDVYFRLVERNSKEG